MRKRRKRLPKLPWPAILWAAFALNMWIGLFQSHLTDLRVIRVTGASGVDAGFLDQVGSGLIGNPSMKIEPHWLESKALELPDIQEATFQRNVFGEARLGLVTYHPVVSIKGTSFGLTSTGVVVQMNGSRLNLPQMSLPGGSLQPIAGVCQPLPLTLFVQATLDLQNVWKEPSKFVAINQDGTMVAISATGPQVEFGSISDFQKKLDVLGQIIQQHPEILKLGTVINLVDPSHPVERNGIQLKGG